MDDIKLEGGITENEFEKMEDSLRNKMTYRCLCAIFSEIKEIKTIVEKNRQASRFVWTLRAMFLAGIAGIAGSVLTYFSSAIVKLLDR